MRGMNGRSCCVTMRYSRLWSGAPATIDWPEPPPLRAAANVLRSRPPFWSVGSWQLVQWSANSGAMRAHVTSSLAARSGRLMELPGQSTLVQLLAPSGGKRALLDSKQVEKLADEKVGKRDCHHLVVKDDGLACDIWIAVGDEPYVLRHKPVPQKLDMDALMSGGGDKEEGEDGAMSVSLMPGFDIEFTEVGKEPGKDSFKITEPASGEKVDDLDKAIREKFTEQMGGEVALDDATDASAGEDGDKAGGGKAHASVGQPAPDVTLTLVGGDAVKLADLKGKVVVLDFWATWCGPCVQGLPKVAEVTSKLKDQGVEFVAVNLGESKAKVEAFLLKKELKIAVALADQALGEKFGVSGIPHTVVIGKDGVVRAVHVGFGPGGEKRLEKDILAALGKGDEKKEPPKEDARKEAGK